MDGLFNARRLQIFTPREGTELAAAQLEFLKKLQDLEEEDDIGEVAEEDEVDEEMAGREEPNTVGARVAARRRKAMWTPP